MFILTTTGTGTGEGFALTAGEIFQLLNAVTRVLLAVPQCLFGLPHTWQQRGRQQLLDAADGPELKPATPATSTRSARGMLLQDGRGDMLLPFALVVRPLILVGLCEAAAFAAAPPLLRVRA